MEPIFEIPDFRNLNRVRFLIPTVPADIRMGACFNSPADPTGARQVPDTFRAVERFRKRKRQRLFAFRFRPGHEIGAHPSLAPDLLDQAAKNFFV